MPSTTPQVCRTGLEGGTSRGKSRVLALRAEGDGTNRGIENATERRGAQDERDVFKIFFSKIDGVIWNIGTMIMIRSE